ncbi:hypothetical protein ACIBSV_45900 [Embleya sp. NPDC050154]|uniref:hypothetical protein n=1 Tax=Embleya sp. NPDC050154 TaxID=3363988 RepID=UPI00379913DE
MALVRAIAGRLTRCGFVADDSVMRRRYTGRMTTVPAEDFDEALAGEIPLGPQAPGRH